MLQSWAKRKSSSMLLLSIVGYRIFSSPELRHRNLQIPRSSPQPWEPDAQLIEDQWVNPTARAGFRDGGGPGQIPYFLLFIAVLTNNFWWRPPFLVGKCPLCPCLSPALPTAVETRGIVIYLFGLTVCVPLFVRSLSSCSGTTTFFRVVLDASYSLDPIV